MSKKLIAALFLVLLFARAGECLLAQEPTQDAIMFMIKDEIKTLEKILDNQDKMLKRWDTSSSEYTNMKEKRDDIIKTITNLRKTLADAKALTHLSNNISSALNSRHPAWKSGMTYDEIKTRQENRETKWKDTLRAYFNSMNSAQSLNSSHEDMRSKLFEILKKPEGQTQAIQALAGFLDHASTQIAMNEYAIQSFITAQAEYERDEMDERQDFGKLTLEVCSTLKNYSPATKKVKLGL